MSVTLSRGSPQDACKPGNAAASLSLFLHTHHHHHHSAPPIGSISKCKLIASARQWNSHSKARLLSGSRLHPAPASPHQFHIRMYADVETEIRHVEVRTAQHAADFSHDRLER